LRTLLVIILVVVTVFAIIVLVPSENNKLDFSSASGKDDTAASSSYSRNPQVISPYDLSRDPYSLSGRPAILTTSGIPLIDRLGRLQGMLPFNSIRYANMIDANTAIYDVLIGDEIISDSGSQIAVHLATDSPRPELGRPWRVVIQNPMRVVNGLGVEHSIATISFQGYGTLPARQEPQTPRHTDTEQPETQAAPTSPSEIEKPGAASQEE
jgi:hypothetical protein